METDMIATCDVCGAKIKGKDGKSADQELKGHMENVHHADMIKK